MQVILYNLYAGVSPCPLLTGQIILSVVLKTNSLVSC